MNNDEWIDEYGVTYSADKKRLIKGNPNLTEYQIFEGCESVKEYAFAHFTYLTSISIPNSITVIERYAFMSCWELKEVHLVNGIKTIGHDAFSYSKSESFYIPDSVSKLVNPFIGCYNLQKIVCDNPYFQSIGGILFSTDLKTIVAFPAGRKEAEYYIPNGVVTIGKHAFASCKNLKNIHIPDSVKIIEDDAFSMCEFQSIIIPDSVTLIGNGAFSLCKSLACITIGKNVISIGCCNFFLSDYKLSEIYCKNQIPPDTPQSPIPSDILPFTIDNDYYLDDNCLQFVDKTTCKLYVPKGSKEAYQKAWGFENIIEE